MFLNPERKQRLEENRMRTSLEFHQEQDEYKAGADGVLTWPSPSTPGSLRLWRWSRPARWTDRGRCAPRLRPPSRGWTGLSETACLQWQQTLHQINDVISTRMCVITNRLSLDGPYVGDSRPSSRSERSRRFLWCRCPRRWCRLRLCRPSGTWTPTYTALWPDGGNTVSKQATGASTTSVWRQHHVTFCPKCDQLKVLTKRHQQTNRSHWTKVHIPDSTEGKMSLVW